MRHGPCLLLLRQRRRRGDRRGSSGRRGEERPPPHAQAPRRRQGWGLEWRTPDPEELDGATWQTCRRRASWSEG
jgi:hypothetical protein